MSRKILSFEVFGIVTTFSLALTVFLIGCERPLANQGVNSISEFYFSEEANDTSSNEPTSSVGASQTITKSEDGECLFAEPFFHFSVGQGFFVREIDRQPTPANEVKFVSVEFFDGEEEAREMAEDLAYFQLKPQLSIAVLEMESEQAVNSKIEEVAKGVQKTPVSIGSNVYLRADTSGLVPEFTYFLVNDQTLYVFIMTNVPSAYANYATKKSADLGFWQVLETFKVE